MVKRQKTVPSELYCTDCGFKMIIPRRRGALREENHLKDMYCIKCNQTTKFEEKVLDKNIAYWKKFQENVNN